MMGKYHKRGMDVGVRGKRGKIDAEGQVRLQNALAIEDRSQPIP